MVRSWTARRRGGARLVTAAYVAVGVSSFLLLGAGPRLLGQEAFSGLALVWTVSTLFGIGLGAPTELLMSRRLNAGAPDAVVAPIRWLVLLAIPSVVACLFLGRLSPSADALPLLPWAMALAVLGWVVVTPARGRLAGAGDLQAYSSLLVAEALLRLLMVCIAVVAPAAADVLLPLGVGLPLLLVGIAGLGVEVPRAAAALLARGSGATWSREHLAFVAVAAGFQVTINGAPLILEWRIGSATPFIVGAFVAASTYFRAPALLVGGVSTHALVGLSHAWGSGDGELFRALLGSALRRATLVAFLSVGLVAAASPLVLPLYYGSGLNLPLSVLVALPISTVVASIGSVAVVPLMAAGRAQTAGALWLAGALVTCVLLAFSRTADAWTAVALVAGPLVTLLGAARVNRRLAVAAARTELEA